MATKNKAAAAAPEKAKAKAPAPLTAGQKAAATKAAKAKAAEVKVVKTPTAPAKPAVKAAAKPAPKAKAEPTEPVDVAKETNTIGRKQLAEAVRSRLKDQGFGVSLNMAAALVESFEASITNAVAAGADVVLPGFGKFKVAVRQGGTRRNPQTGESMEVASAWALSFKVGKALKDAVNSRPVE